MQAEGGDVNLFAVTTDGKLTHYREVTVTNTEHMPSGGALTNPADLAVIQMLEDKMVEAFGAAIAWRGCEGDEEVDLGNKMIRPVHVPELTNALTTNGVTALDLHSNQLGAVGAAALAAALPRCTCLRELNLRANAIELAGAEAIACVLPECSLTDLDLRWNGLGVAGAEALARVLPRSKLTALNLMNNGLGDEGATALAHALPASGLKALVLRFNDLTEAVKASLQAVERVEAKLLKLTL